MSDYLHVLHSLNPTGGSGAKRWAKIVPITANQSTAGGGGCFVKKKFTFVFPQLKVVFHRLVALYLFNNVIHNMSIKLLYCCLFDVKKTATIE